MYAGSHIARYQASRPWAKRVAQLFVSQDEAAAACQVVAAMVRQELERADALYGLRDAQREMEYVLAEAYGLFVRDGRRVFALDESCQAALAATRPLAALPAGMALPEGTFVLSLMHEGEQAAAFVTHHAAQQQLDMLLLQPDFAPPDSPWYRRVEAALTLGVRYPDSVQVPATPEFAVWRGWLQCSFSQLALLLQARVRWQQTWSPALDAQQQQVLLHGAAKDKQSLRASLLKSGAQQILLGEAVGLPAGGAAVERAGYWRMQAGRDGGAERVVWVPPRTGAGA